MLNTPVVQKQPVQMSILKQCVRVLKTLIRGQELQISISSLHRILAKDLCLRAYKIQLTQQLKPNDHEQRREFVEWIINREKVDASFSSKIILSTFSPRWLR